MSLGCAVLSRGEQVGLAQCRGRVVQTPQGPLCWWHRAKLRVFGYDWFAQSYGFAPRIQATLPSEPLPLYLGCPTCGHTFLPPRRLVAA